MYKCVIYILLLLSLIYCDVSAKANKHKGHCEPQINAFSEAVKNYTQCSIYNASPVSYCTECEIQFQTVSKCFRNLLNGTSTDPTPVPCKNLYFDQDRINIIETVYKDAVALWNKGYCSSCYDDDGKKLQKVVEIETANTTLSECITSSTNPCIICLKDYLDMNALYTQIQDSSSKGDVCYDIQDMMNITRLMWSADLKCCSRTDGANMVPFIIVSSVLTSIPVLFYIGLYFYTKRREMNHEILSTNPSQRQRPNGNLSEPEVSTGIVSTHIPSSSREDSEVEPKSYKTKNLKEIKMAKDDSESEVTDDEVDIMRKPPPNQMTENTLIQL